jgi:hypothetical protein
MKVVEIWTRPNSSDVLTCNKKTGIKRYTYHNFYTDNEITRERFDQLVKEKGFTLLNTIVI